MEDYRGDKMKKSELKQLIKPLVKECIHEVLLEEGLLSTVVSEVTKGLQANLIVENIQQQEKPPTVKKVSSSPQETRAKLSEHRQKLMDSIGNSSYNGIDLFEGTTPTQEAPTPGSPDLGDANDAGVDISSIVGNASQLWRAMK